MPDKTYKLPTPPPQQQMQQQQQQTHQATSQQQTLFPPNANSIRAQRDYEMQLALLDQQNKKRALMCQQWEDERFRVPMHHDYNRLQYFQMQLVLEQQNNERLRRYREQCDMIKRGARRDSKL